eukprot:scaffold14.g1322.t1
MPLGRKRAITAAAALAACAVCSLHSHRRAEASLRRRLADTSDATGGFQNVSTTVRLVSDTSVAQDDGSQKGVVKVWREGAWGRVCKFGNLEAAVVCRQLGHCGGAFASSASSPPSGFVFMKGVDCAGTEATVQDCAHATVNTSTCSGGYAAIACFPNDKRQANNSVGVPFDPKLPPGQIQGPLYFFRHGIWGAICTEFGPAEAAVACRELGYTGTATTDSSSSASSLTWISNVTCNGTESRLADCHYTDKTAAACPNGYATLTCTNAESAAVPLGGEPEVPIRLTGSKSCTSGRLEMYAHGLWGQVCTLDNRAASVVCCQLGMSSDSKAVTSSYASSSNGQVVWVSNATCEGSESSLSDCRLNLTVGLSESCKKGYAMVQCAPPSDSGTWDPASICKVPGPCQLQDGGNCSVASGHCVYPPKEQGTNCSSSAVAHGVCDGKGTCIGLDKVPSLAKYNASFGLPFPYLDAACFQNNSCFAGLFALVSVPQIGLSMIYAKDGVQQLVDIGKAANANITTNISDATASIANKIFDRESFANCLVMTWFADWGATIADVTTQAATAVGQATKDAASAVYEETVDAALKAKGMTVEACNELKGALRGAWDETMCGEWINTHSGFYAGDLALSACKGGKATLSGGGMDGHGGPVTEECRLEGEKASVETLYESACVQKADDGPWAPVYIAGMLLRCMEEKAGALVAPLAISGEELATYQQLLQSIDFDTYADYNSLFWPAGMFHDWCCHHNPITYGKSKADCDAGLYETAMSVCAGGVDRWFNQAHNGGPSRDPATCHLVAFLYYLGVATRLPTDWAKKLIYDEPGAAWQAANTKARVLGRAQEGRRAPGGQTTEGKDCAGLVPHCDLCYTPVGSGHPLCLACTSPYMADGKGDCVLVTNRINSLKFDVKCDFQCPPEKRTSGDWNLGCRCTDATCTRVVCELDTPQDNAQNPDLTWTCPVIASRASCGDYSRLAAFLNSSHPLLSNTQADSYSEVTPYSNTDGYQCVLNTGLAVRSLTFQVLLPSYTSTTRNQVYAGMDKNEVVTTSLGSRLLLPKRSLVDFVGPKFETQCDKWALVCLSWPPAGASATAQPSYALAYMKEDCLVYDAKLNKCPNSAIAASQKPFSCATNAECCTGRCNCPPTLGGDMQAFDMPVRGVKLPSGGELMQRIRPADFGASLFKKVCCGD